MGTNTSRGRLASVTVGPNVGGPVGAGSSNASDSGDPYSRPRRKSISLEPHTRPRAPRSASCQGPATARVSSGLHDTSWVNTPCHQILERTLNNGRMCACLRLILGSTISVMAK